MRREPRDARRGVALLPVVATIAVLALVASAVASAAQGRVRSARLAVARAAVAARADRARDEALALVRGGAWRALDVPGTTRALPVVGAGDTVIVARLGRPAWERLVLQVVVEAPAGVAGRRARVARRLELGLVVPWPIPDAPLTGVRAWTVAGGVTDLAVDDLATRRCTDGAPVPVPAQRLRGAPALDTLLASSAAVVVDPDTVAGALAGVVVIPAGRPVRRALAVDGWLVAAGALDVRAPVTVTGVLVAGGAVDTRDGGALRVDGAAWSLDSAGAGSHLRSGDTVAWAPCAIRRARDRLAVLAPVGTWGGADGR
jgi:type II secretory pathway pseudopilin PulG